MSFPPLRIPGNALAALVAAALLWGSPAFSGVCDYRPSELLGGGAAAATITASGGASAAGVGLNALGYYTLFNYANGAIMLANVNGGIIAGTMGGTLASVAGVLLSPVAIVAGAVVAVGVGGMEGICYLTDDNITDRAAIMDILQSMADHADPAHFRLGYDNELDGMTLAIYDQPSRTWEKYLVRKLYIQNGVLKHSDWGTDTVIGRVGFITVSETDATEEPAEAQ